VAIYGEVLMIEPGKKLKCSAEFSTEISKSEGILNGRC